MHARVNYRQLPPDRMDEAISIYRVSVVPRHIGAQGFKGALVLTGRSTGKVIAISMCERESDLKAFAPGAHVNAVSGGPPLVEIQEVSVYDRAETDIGRATHARVTTRQVQSGKMDEAIHTYLNSAVPLRRQQGSIGALLLTDRGTGKVLNITLWKSESEMDAAEPSGDVDNISVGQHSRETYEVSADI